MVAFKGSLCLDMAGDLASKLQLVSQKLNSLESTVEGVLQRFNNLESSVSGIKREVATVIAKTDNFEKSVKTMDRMEFLAIESLRISLKFNISAAREQQAVGLGPLM